MIRQRDRFSFSEFLYALDLDSYSVNEERQSRKINAIWFKKKNGVVAVCSGTLNSFYSHQSQDPSVEEFMRSFDGRYGGRTEYKWDGTEMWSSDNNFLNMVEAHRILDPILNDFPNIPAGYSGWFSIKD